MKNKLAILSLFIVLCPALVFAQRDRPDDAQLKATATGHSVSLAWTASVTVDPTLGYQVYRLGSACPAIPPTTIAGATGFVLINPTPQAGVTFIDNGPTGSLPLGTYCYFVVANVPASMPPQSVPSNLVQATVAQPPPAPPTGLTVTGLTAPKPRE